MTSSMHQRGVNQEDGGRVKDGQSINIVLKRIEDLTLPRSYPLLANCSLVFPLKNFRLAVQKGSSLY